jgi:hypothetical protein
MFTQIFKCSRTIERHLAGPLFDGFFAVTLKPIVMWRSIKPNRSSDLRIVAGRHITELAT